MIRSNESASGIPWLELELLEWIESFIEPGFSAEANELLDGGGTYGGRVYVSEWTILNQRERLGSSTTKE